MVRKSIGTKTKIRLSLKFGVLVLSLVFAGVFWSIAVITYFRGPAGLPHATFLPEGTYAPGTVLVKFKPNVNPSVMIQEVLGKPQTVYQHKTSGQIVSQFDPAVTRDPNLYQSRALKLSLKKAERTLPPIRVAEVVKAKIMRRAGVTKGSEDLAREIGLDRWYTITVRESSADIAALIQSFQARTGQVETAQADLVSKPSTLRLADDDPEPTGASQPAGLTPDDPYFSSTGTWGQTYRDQWSLPAVKADGAWTLTRGDPSVVIAVLDTGVDFAHVDVGRDNLGFKPNIWINGPEDVNGNGCADYWPTIEFKTDCRGLSGIPGDLDGQDNDANGYTDDINGVDMAYAVGNGFRNDSDGPSDPIGHGTLVAGVIAAQTDNQLGIAGVCWTCQIMPLRLGDGAFSHSVQQLALYYASGMGADVINMSFTGQSSPLQQDGVVHAAGLGVVLVSTVDDDNGNADDDFPAGYPEVMAVTGWTSDGQRYPDSAAGVTLDLTAPAQEILSLRAANTNFHGDASRIINTDYYRGFGLSFAVPFVSGTAGLMRAVNPYLTSQEVVSILQQTAQDVGDPFFDIYTGHGLLNAQAAVQEAKDRIPDLRIPSAVATSRFSNTKLQLSALLQNGSFSPNSRARDVVYQVRDAQTQALLVEKTIHELDTFGQTVNELISLPSVPTQVTVVVDPNNQIPESNELNNEFFLLVQPNQAPSLPPIGQQVGKEGQLLQFSVAGSDPNSDVLTYTYTPTNLGALLDPNTGVFKWEPNFTQAGTYNLTFTATDGEFSTSQTTTITIADEANVPPYRVLIPGQGFARSIEDGKLVADDDSSTGQWGRSHYEDADRLGLSDAYDLRNKNIDFNDVRYIRVTYNTNGRWNAPVPTNFQYEPDTRVRKSGSSYIFEFDLLDPSGWSGPTYWYDFRFVEQDDAGRNFGSPGFAGWWPSGGWWGWREECLNGATGGGNKNGLGVEVQARDFRVNFISFCVMDDDGGSINPSWTAYAFLKSLNQPPVLNSINNQVISEGQSVAVTLTSSDFNTDFVTYSATGLPAGAMLDPNTGQFSWTPSFTQSGTYTVSFTASDGMATDTKTAQMTVNNIDQVPVLAPIGNKSVALCQGLAIQLSVTNPDEDPLTYSGSNMPSPSSLNPTTGLFTFSALCDPGVYAPYYDVTFRVTDSHGKTDSETIRITIEGVSSPGGGGGGGGGGDYKDYVPPHKRFLFE